MYGSALSRHKFGIMGLTVRPVIAITNLPLVVHEAPDSAEEGAFL